MRIRKEGKKKRQFRSIYDEHMGQLYRFIFLKVGSHEVAEDLASRTFLKLWEALQKEKELQNPRAFLYRVARNLIIDHYRRRQWQRTTTVEEIRVESREELPSEIATVRAEMEEVRRALTKLNEDYQNIIIWYYLNELSIPEIADVSGKTEATVRVTIHRAVSALRKELANQRKPRNNAE